MTSSLRRPLIAGNWKMNLGLADSVKLARGVREGLSSDGGPRGDAVLCVPHTALSVVAQVLDGGPVLTGAQNLHWAPEGAYTGEISARQLKDAGARAVIIGHSERRRSFGENDAIVRRKLGAALSGGLLAIVCVGETLEEREGHLTWKALRTQVQGSLKDLAPADAAKIAIAYEPVWAIGTGKTASPQIAQEAHAFLRKEASSLYGEGFAAALRILYGGSVKADNADSLMSQPDIDGALVGGESLKLEPFLRIIHFNAKD